jgi:hydrogenase maturation protease
MLSLQPSTIVLPWLVLAIGNPSRGDDALGPLAAQRLAAMRLPGVEVLTDFQLQVEHVIDLLCRRGVIFIDAAASGAAPFELQPLGPAPDLAHSTHSMSPAAVLDAYRRLTGEEPPPAQLLAIRGHEFELGAPLSTAAAANLEAALQAVLPLLRSPPPPQATSPLQAQRTPERAAA